MNPNSRESHNNMTAKISLHAQMIMTQLPYLRTVVRGNLFYGLAWRGPFSKTDIDVTTPGATCEGIAEHCGLTEMQVVRRCSELKRAGLIDVSPEKYSYKSDGRIYHKSIWYAK